MKKLILPAVFISLLFSGCFLFDTNDVTTKCKVNKIVSSDNTAQFVFSDDGLLTEINNTNTWNVRIEYDPIKRIKKVEYYNRNADTLDFYSAMGWINDLLVTVGSYEYQNGTWVMTSKTDYTLNNDGDIIKAEYMEKLNSDWQVTSYTDYTITNGNTVKAETYVINNGTFEKQYTTTYEYDNKANALSDISLQSVSEITQYLWFGKNNPVKIETVDNQSGSMIYSATFEYQYNSDDLPVSYTRNDVLASGNTQVYTVSSIEYTCE